MLVHHTTPYYNAHVPRVYNMSWTVLIGIVWNKSHFPPQKMHPRVTNAICTRSRIHYDQLHNTTVFIRRCRAYSKNNKYVVDAADLVFSMCTSDWALVSSYYTTVLFFKVPCRYFTYDTYSHDMYKLLFTFIFTLPPPFGPYFRCMMIYEDDDFTFIRYNNAE